MLDPISAAMAALQGGKYIRDSVNRPKQEQQKKDLYQRAFREELNSPETTRRQIDLYKQAIREEQNWQAAQKEAREAQSFRKLNDKLWEDKLKYRQEKSEYFKRTGTTPHWDYDD